MKIELRTVINKDDELLVYNVFKMSSNYFMKVEGRSADEKILRNELDSKPKNISADYSKEFVLIYSEEVPVGVVDLHLNHPEKQISYIGLFLLIEELHGQGMGTRTFHALENYLKGKNIHRIRLGVSDDNDVSPFWHKLGFSPNGRTYEFQGAHRVTHVIEFEKAVRGNV